MSLANEESRFQNKGGAFAIGRPIVVVRFSVWVATNPRYQAESDIIDTQSGSAGEHPDRTKGRAVFSSENRGPFAL